MSTLHWRIQNAGDGRVYHDLISSHEPTAAGERIVGVVQKTPDGHLLVHAKGLIEASEWFDGTLDEAKAYVLARYTLESTR